MKLLFFPIVMQKVGNRHARVLSVPSNVSIALLYVCRRADHHNAISPSGNHRVQQNIIVIRVRIRIMLPMLMAIAVVLQNPFVARIIYWNKDYRVTRAFLGNQNLVYGCAKKHLVHTNALLGPPQGQHSSHQGYLTPQKNIGFFCKPILKLLDFKQTEKM